MNIDDLLALAEKSHRAEIDLLRRKGADYSPGEDTLACFKRIAEAYNIPCPNCGHEVSVPPILVAAIFLEKHLDAIRTYISRGKLQVEELWVHKVDGQNYLNIICAIDEERSESEDSVNRGPR